MDDGGSCTTHNGITTNKHDIVSITSVLCIKMRAMLFLLKMRYNM